MSAFERARDAVTGDNTGTSSVDIGVDDALGLLANSRRRHVIQALAATSDGELHISDVSRRIAAHECDTTPDAVTGEERKRVYVALYQSHLDKLDKAGALEYTKRSGSITATPATHVLASIVHDVTTTIGGDV
ncbi:DUF7344 domain-containing protein [Haloarchaeobius sp. HRN-SO-5]|uniref:DUF7344 domain-containing protein n=1 Tax=Haloarchaeobius sp. HRN-SO-5 TaxID=3446118 RepID=UPI003EB87083